MQKSITDKLSLEDFHVKILRRFAAINNSLLKSVNLNEMQYLRLVNTPEGKEKLRAVLEKKPEWKPIFIRLETLRKCQEMIDKEYENYLPF